MFESAVLTQTANAPALSNRAFASDCGSVAAMNLRFAHQQSATLVSYGHTALSPTYEAEVSLIQIYAHMACLSGVGVSHTGRRSAWFLTGRCQAPLQCR